MIKLELKNIVRNPLVLILVFFLFVFILFASYNGENRVNKQLEGIALVKEKEQTFYTNHKNTLKSIENGAQKAPARFFEDPSNPVGMGNYYGGVYLTSEPAALAAISNGQSDIFPYYTKINISSTNAGKDNDNFENPMNIATGGFDLAFVFVFILPLLIIAFSYNILSSEKEQGTLRLLLSMPINIKLWLLKKIVFRYVFIVLIISVLLSLSLSVVSVNIFNATYFTLLFSIALYTLFWFALAFVINLLNKSSSQNIILLLGTWLLFVLIIPSFVNIMASSIHPAPSRVEFVTAKRDIEKNFEKKEEVILQKYYEENPSELEKNNKTNDRFRAYWNKNFILLDEKRKFMDAFESKYENQSTKQRALAKNLSWFSPAILLQNTMNKIAKTDTQHYLNFQYEAKIFQKEWTNYFYNKYKNHQKLTVEDFNNFPKPKRN
ncbi:ABC transporter permease subunit [Formosa sediminum]|uniref:ABC transporter permease subunit n=1 Tax=Formosa sediminum TaxID=2594004 RepID=A0A516GVH9_9FLAO|nr:ABC transporter permease subunit [Formosa sediminum]QDO95522.1 ABC transporter permease subunit [Formosa sediminum]